MRISSEDLIAIVATLLVFLLVRCIQEMPAIIAWLMGAQL